MQEVQQLGSDFIAHLVYNFYWTDLKEKIQHGSGIAMHESLDIVTDDILHQPGRLMVVNVVVYGYKIRGN